MIIGQPIGVSAAVEPLVVMTDDLGDFLQRLHLGDHAGAEDGVLLDLLEVVPREFVWLAEDTSAYE